MITWLQLGLQSKPLVLVNVAGYFDPLLQWVRQAVEADFVRSGSADLLRTEPTPQAALARLEKAVAN